MLGGDAWQDAVALDEDNRLFGVMSLDFADGRIRTIHSIANPDKLEHLHPGTTPV